MDEKLYTPEEVAARLKHLSAFTIRRLAAQKKIQHRRMARGKVLLSEGDVQGLVDFFKQEVQESEAPVEVDPFPSTGRSQAIARGKAS